MKLFTRLMGLFLLTALSGCNAVGQESLEPKDFKTILTKTDIQLVDIRTPDEYAMGYIKGAQNIDFYEDDFVERISKLNKEKPLAIYCKSGGRTKEAIAKLDKSGFKLIYILKGGLDAWTKAGNTTVKPTPAEPVKKAVTKAEYENLIKSEKVVIIEFGATWCGPCKLLKPVLDKINTDYIGKHVKIITIDVDLSKELSNHLLVNEIPLLLFYQNGVLKEQMIGFNPENIITEALNKYL